MAGKYLSYAEYKDSGVEWLGEVPSGWSTCGVWMLFSLGRGCVISNEEIAENIGVYPVYSSQTKNEGIMGSLNTYDFDGDFITWTTDGANAGTVFTRSGRFNCTNVCGTLRARSEQISLRFYMYAFSVATAWFVRHDINPKLMNNVMSAIRIPVLGYFEQTKIANFLDHETAKIDTLIAKQQQLIKLLKEKCQAVISHAVTKGLNPDAPMKDSGVEWLGEVPEHWKVVKGGYIGRLFGSESIQEDQVVDEGILPFIKVSSLTPNGFEVKEFNWFVSEVKAPFCQPEKDYIVFPKRGAAIFTNKVNVINKRSLIDPNLMGWKINGSALTEYVAHLLKTRGLADIADVSTVPQINNKHIAPEKFPVPPKIEQKEIIQYITREISKFDKLIARSELAIELIQERRTALISAAVTGKIDVRNWKP